jgi:hypothetical protein
MSWVSWHRFVRRVADWKSETLQGGKLLRYVEDTVCVHDFMDEFEASQTGSARLTELLDEFLSRKLPVPKFIWTKLLTVGVTSDLCEVFLGDPDGAAYHRLMTRLQWAEEASLQDVSDLESDDDEAATGIGDAKISNKSDAAMPAVEFDVKNPKLSDLPFALEEKVGFLSKLFRLQILPACTNRGKETQYALARVCQRFESLCELQLAALPVASPEVTALLRSVRVVIGVVAKLPKPEHFTALLAAIAKFHAREAGDEYDLIAVIFLKGWYRERIQAIVKGSADLQNAVQGMAAQTARGQRLQGFLPDADAFTNHIDEAFAALAPARQAPLLPGATTDYELRLLTMLQDAQKELAQAHVCEPIGTVDSTTPGSRSN